MQQNRSHRDGYVLTHFRRRFKIWEYDSPLRGIQAKGERMSVNAPVQGSAADFMKLSLVKAYKIIKAAGLEDKIRMVLTVHDAIEWYVHDSISTQEVLDLLMPAVNYPAGPAPLLPLEVRADWHEGPTWADVADLRLDANKQIIDYKIEVKGKGDVFFETYQDYLDFMHTAPTAPVDVVPPTVEAEEEPAWQHAKESVATIVLSDMPEAEQWEEFKQWLRPANPGIELVIETPQGSVTMDGRYALTLADQPLVSLLFSGADLKIGPKDVDLSELEDVML